MLPILRTISVGGVLLAIAILGLALIPPSRTHMQFAGADAPARGALIDRLSHPEWRQFLILSAVKRAEEVERLRGLSGMPNGIADEPASTPEALSQLAGLPSAPSEVAPDDETGSINVAPNATMPIDIGETSSFELPVSPNEEKMPVTTLPVVSATSSNVPPVVTTAHPLTSEPLMSKVAALSPPEQIKPVVIIRKRAVRKPAAKSSSSAPQTETSMPPPFNIIQAFFASLSGNPVVSTEQQAKPVVLRRPGLKSKNTAGLR